MREIEKGEVFVFGFIKVWAEGSRENWSFSLELLLKAATACFLVSKLFLISITPRDGTA